MRPLKGAEGEWRLVLEILLDAVRLALEGAADPRRRHARKVVEATQWIWRDDVFAPFSFLNVTEYLDLDPQGVRDAVDAARRSVASGEAPTPGNWEIALRIPALSAARKRTSLL